MTRSDVGLFDTIEQAAAALRKEVDRLAPGLAKAGNGAGIRCEAGIPATDPLAWLNYHDNLIRMYCSNREQELQIAAMGCADMLRYKEEDIPLREALNQLFARLDHLPAGMRYYGGMRFQEDGSNHDSTWKRFGRVRFVLPAIELIRDAHRTILAVNLIASPDLERDVNLLGRQLHALKTPPALAAAHLPLPVNRVNQPDRDEWDRMLMSAFDLMRSGDLKKIVLARRCSFDFKDPLLPMALLQRLHECTPDSFHFSFNYGNEIAFIGASPERLYHRKGRDISSEALAGTRPRGATEDDDAWLASELMASAKERREHGLVAEAITGVLERFCESVSCHAAPEILKLSHVQHLRTVITGKLREPVSDADLLMALHPTPAVGGWPTDHAMRSIATLEPFDRGWYSAPIGWAMKDEAEFAVAIRCGLVEGSRLSLFSGAGIMPESNPEQEWREIESKIGNFLRILTS
jgi:menaquinone-specific isochorismate synthase